MRESTTRAMLAAYDDVTGALDAGVRALADGRRFTRWPSGDPLAPYDRQQWERLQDICRRIADDAFAGHRRALAAARPATTRSRPAGTAATCAGCWSSTAR